MKTLPSDVIETNGKVSIVFHSGVRKDIPNEKLTVAFEKYFVDGYSGFDFHDKFNNGISPPEYVMYGKIERETEKMYVLDLISEDGTKKWHGWCPKKCCKIER